MNSVYHTELSSHEGTRCQFNGGKADIKSAEGRIRPHVGLGIDVHQEFYVVVMPGGLKQSQTAAAFAKGAFLHWAARLRNRGAELYAVYEACGFWVFFALVIECSGDSLLRGLPAKTR